MCYDHSKMNFSNDWLMEIDDNTYLSVKTIREYFGDEFCLILPAYHSITGCDTTSFPANIGKIRPLTKMLKGKEFHLLRNLGSSINSFKDVTLATKFYHLIMYSGRRNESIIDTRVRMYEKQKKKSSMNLISDESSVKHHILRADFQAFIWKQCMDQNMIVPSIDGSRRWQEKMVWFFQYGTILPNFPRH